MSGYRDMGGIDISGRHKDAKLCMVVGCERVALYRNGTRGVERGYCAAHKHLALRQLSEQSIETQARHLLRGVD